MLERRFAAKAAQFLKRLEPDFLRNVLDLAFQAGISAGRGKDARRVLLDQRLKACGIAFQHRRDQLRFGPFHRVRLCQSTASAQDRWSTRKEQQQETSNEHDE